MTFCDKIYNKYSYKLKSLFTIIEIRNLWDKRKLKDKQYSLKKEGFTVSTGCYISSENEIDCSQEKNALKQHR